MRRRHLVTVLLTLSALLLASPGIARAGSLITDVEAVLEPGAPTWHDPLVVRITGISECFVEVADSRVDLASLVVELRPICILDPPFPTSFELEVPFPGRTLVPLNIEYTLRVVGEPEDTFFEMPFRTFYEADLVIEPLIEVPTDLTPFRFRVTGVTGSCVGEGPPPEVMGNVISLDFPDECPFLFTGESVSSFEYTVGPLPAGDYEIWAFEDVRFAGTAVRRQVTKLPIRIFESEGCIPSSSTLCLQGDRFRVEASWKDFQGGSGEATALPLAGREDTGLFWFFDPANVELTVKVLDGCTVNGHFWVFVSSGSTVEYEIAVTDVVTGESRAYENASGATPPLIPDTTAFATCP